MAVSSISISDNTYLVTYEGGDTATDILKGIENVITTYGYTKVDSGTDTDDSGNDIAYWTVFKNTDETGVEYYIRLYIKPSKNAMAVELYENWDSTNHTGTNECVSSKFRDDNLNGNQRLDFSNGGQMYIFVNRNWLCFVGKTIDGYGDLKYNSFTGVFNRKRHPNETTDKYDYPAVVYLCGAHMCYGWVDGSWKDWNARYVVGVTRLVGIDGNIVNSPDNTSWFNGISYITKSHKSDAVYSPPYFTAPNFLWWKDPISDKYLALDIRIGIDQILIKNSYIYGIKHLSKIGELFDTAIIKCNSEYFIDEDNGTDTEHWILLSKDEYRFAIPK